MSLLRQFQPTLQVASPAALQFQDAIAALPDANTHPTEYRKAISALNEKFADFLRLQTQVQLVELSQQDPDEYMRVMPKILDNFIPKMKSVEAKVDSIIDHRIYVETAYREPIPVDALKKAGVVIDSEVEPVAQGSTPDEQSPGRPVHSHPVPSASLPNTITIRNDQPLHRPLSVAMLKVPFEIIDEDVLS